MTEILGRAKKQCHRTGVDDVCQRKHDCLLPPQISMQEYWNAKIDVSHDL